VAFRLGHIAFVTLGLVFSQPHLPGGRRPHGGVGIGRETAFSLLGFRFDEPGNAGIYSKTQKLYSWASG
jgi:hypothetical protein